MKKPSDRGQSIDAVRIKDWLHIFANYRHAVSEGSVDRWLGQFQTEDRDLAARLLDSVDFITSDQITAKFRTALNSLTGWNKDTDQRQGEWRFVAYSASAGESADTMIHTFRHANGLASSRYNKHFIYKSNLPMENLGPNDTVVFIDDFSGSGRQVIENWPSLQELLTGSPKVYLLLIAASVQAIEKIQDETDIEVLSSILLSEADGIFNDACKHFTEDEKTKLLGYCKLANLKTPKGFGDAGLVIVFSHTCPNNSLPILHASHQRWQGLFRRHN